MDEYACITAIGRDDDLFKVNSSVFEDKLEKSRRTLLELLRENAKESGKPFVMETDRWLSFFLKKMGKLTRGGFPENPAIRIMLVKGCGKYLQSVPTSC